MWIRFGPLTAATVWAYCKADVVNADLVSGGTGLFSWTCDYGAIPNQVCWILLFPGKGQNANISTFFRISSASRTNEAACRGWQMRHD